MKRLSFLCLPVACAVLLAAAQPAAHAAPVERGSPQTANTCDGGEGVYLYANTQYRGDCRKLTDDVSDLSDLGFNNVTSSIRFVGEWTATLYVGQGYSGASSTFTREDSDLSNNTVGNNDASAVRVQRGRVPAENICDGDEGVYLYTEPQYLGMCIKLTGDAPDLSEQGINNAASSIRFVGEWTATLFVDQDYSGASSTFTRDDSDLSNNSIGNDSASSARVQRGRAGNCDGGEGAYLYEHPQYQGRCLKLTSDAPDLRTAGFDDTASSIRILGSWTVTLYRDLSGTGIASTFSADDPNLADDPIGDNQTTSVSVQRAGGPAGSSCDGGEGIYLYEHPQYQGRCLKLTGDAPDLRTVGFDDTASSIRILGNWTATVYRDLSDTGIASAFSADDPNLADDAIGDNQATSVGVQRAGGPAGSSCDGGEGAYLFEHPQYQGRCLKLTGDAPDLRVFGFDDSVSSIRILGNWSVTLYRDLSGTGTASTFTLSDPNVIDDAIGDNQATSVGVQRR